MHRIRTVVFVALVLVGVAMGSSARAEVLGPACPAGELRIVVGEPPTVGPCLPFRRLPSRELRRMARSLERSEEACGPGGVVLRVTTRQGAELVCRISV